MKASIFIPTGNRSSSLKKVLQSLTRQSYKNFEVIIVDYKSDDATPSVIKSYQTKLRIRVIQQKQKGLARAANLALQKATGAVFIRTDDDVIMTTHWLRSIIETFASDSNIGGVTGPTIIPASHRNNRDLFALQQKMKKGSVLWKICGWVYYSVLLEGKAMRVSEWLDSGAFTLGSNYARAKKISSHEISNLEACNFSVRTRLLRKVGGFDTSYTGVGEYHEPDAAFKIRNLGYRLFFSPKAALFHCPSQDGFYHDRPDSYSRMRNFIRFYKKHIRLNHPKKVALFTAYLMFLNTYYCYIAIQTRQPKQLGAVPGTLMGLLR